MSNSSSRRPSLPVIGLVLVVAAALTLRVLRLGWQPLWWDEGYSIYFATEPLGRMLWLTANDIHPPLYYALLNLWASLVGVAPESVRLFSTLTGALAVGLMVWLGRVYFSDLRAVAWIAALLLAVNPMHLYYSQEVRMYGLAMVLGMLSSGLLWLAIGRAQAGNRGRGLWVAYVVASTAALYTLYYAALLLVGQAIWALWTLHRKPRILGSLILAWTAVFLLFLPWLAYVLPRLAGYISQKLTSDQDRSLDLLRYSLNHLSAFLVGHVARQDARVAWGQGLALLALALIAAGAYFQARRRQPASAPGPSATVALAAFILVPACIGFLLNLRLPFFPEGGERLMLIILPYALLLIAAGINRAGALGIAGGVAFVAASLCGIWVFYTTPRYADEDFRPIIREIVTKGAAGDSLLATFPWMVGYWRAYAPAGIDGPSLELLSETALEYGPAVEERMRSALERSAPLNGKVWFPEPLAYGSALPVQMESWLRDEAINVENRWFGDNTRLTAWARPVPVDWEGQHVAFGPLALLGAGVGSSAKVVASNAVLPVGLAWAAPIPRQGLSVSLRLVDPDGRIWATREYAPAGAFASAPSQGTLTETVGLIVPAGLPPGDYTLALAIAVGANSTPLLAVSQTLTQALQAPISNVRVESPESALALERIPMTPALQPRVEDGLTWVGSTLPTGPALAGTDVTFELIGQSLVATPPARALYVNLINSAGDAVAGWQGWPLTRFPTSMWSKDIATIVPVALHLSADLASGAYSIAGGWLNPETGLKSPPVDFGRLEVTSRSMALDFPSPQVTLEPAPQFGTHARLRGYTIDREGEQLTLSLTWEVLQTLLPPHHIFVHADDENGVTLAQADGPPMTLDGDAPTGSWRPGEFLVSRHALAVPSTASALRIGIYDPSNEIRLPVSIEGVATGDAITLDLTGRP